MPFAFVFVMFVLASTMALFAPSFVMAQQDPKVEEFKRQIEAVKGKVRALEGNSSFERGVMAQLENVEQEVEQSDLCEVLELTDDINTRLQRARKPANQALVDDLFLLMGQIRGDVLSTYPEARKCQGYEGYMRDPAVQERESDNQGYAAQVRFGLPSFTGVRANNELFMRVHVPGVDEMTGEPGMPAIPRWRTLIALPEGADLDVSPAEILIGLNVGVNLVPYQEQPVDQAQQDELVPAEPPFDTFRDKPFVKNEDAYKKNELLPATDDICETRILGELRGLRIAQIECVLGQYNPATDQLTMFEGFDMNVSFKGGTGPIRTFGSTRMNSPFESRSALVKQSVINASAVSKYLRPESLVNLVCRGEELLILTHPSFRAAADDLAEWKNAKGIATNVFEVNDGAGPGPDTNEQIDDFIEDRYDDCITRPSYVMLMGDAEFVPTFHLATSGSPVTGSDFPYANYYMLPLLIDVFPDFGVGRAPVDTLQQANDYVDKVIAYEKTPPSKASFYQKAAIASQFQCCRTDVVQDGTDQRTFAEVSEFGRNSLLSQGYSVDRIYRLTVDSAYTRDDTPRRWFDGTLIPAASGIAPGSGFGWNGDTDDIVDAWNDGRFLIVHRDHGWPHGWGDPPFDSNTITQLVNGALQPIVWSINCASGLFDNETAGGDYGTTTGQVYFAERLLRKTDGGAVGVLGDTRNSPSWPNTALTRGFFDAVWPGTVPSFGPASSQRRLADVLDHGKMFMLSQIGVPGAGVDLSSSISELNMWHALGDPTLEMWTKKPSRLSAVAELAVLKELLKVTYKEEGAIITAYQLLGDGSVRPLARGTVKNGGADLPLLDQPVDGVEIKLAACIDDSVCEPIIADDDGGAFLDFSQDLVDVPPGGTFTVDVIVDSNGNDIQAVDAYIKHDAAVVVPVKIEPGDMFDSVSSAIYSKKFLIRGRLSEGGARSGRGVLAKVTMRKKNPRFGEMAFYCAPTDADRSRIVQANLAGTDIIDCDQNGTLGVKSSTTATATPPVTATPTAPPPTATPTTTPTPTEEVREPPASPTPTPTSTAPTPTGGVPEE
jgi:hypothetical protein